jgi:hypothetical protein
VRASKRKPIKDSRLSITALAAAVGKSPSAVRKWVRHSSWAFGPGPWATTLVPKIKTWAAATLAPDRAAGQIAPEPTDAGGLTKHDLELRHLRGKIKKLELGIGKESKLLVLRSDVESREVRQAQVVKQELMGVKGLAVKMEGMTVLQRENLLESWARAVCEKFARAKFDESTAGAEA